LREARILLAHVLGRDRTWLAAHDEQTVEEPEAERFRALSERRLRGEPIAYLVGEREFFGLSLAITPAVLIPRPETELVVSIALERLPESGAVRVLDLGTGSGAIAIAIAHARPDAQVVAADLCPAALELARANAARHAAHNIEFAASDWFAGLVPGSRFDCIVSNPPYVAAADPHLGRGDVRFEPLIALTPGRDGLEALQCIIRGAPGFLAGGGWLVVEHGYDQAGACRELLQQNAFGEIRSHRDLAGHPRAASARMGAPLR